MIMSTFSIPSDQISIESILEAVLKSAEESRQSAAWSGSRDDGGASLASLTETKVNFYKMGMNRVIPKEWEGYLKKQDPEYDEYLRLKKKFE